MVSSLSKEPRTLLIFSLVAMELSLAWVLALDFLDFYLSLKV